ncbi:MAG: hypothetical protein U9N34_09500 [Candidatus Cloacimonadota bacterium]|nr:hypothetical protein [Candidatus Cloacimonadota bacterium]
MSTVGYSINVTVNHANTVSVGLTNSYNGYPERGASRTISSSSGTYHFRPFDANAGVPVQWYVNAVSQFKRDENKKMVRSSQYF